MKTRQDLIEATLELLNAIAAGQPPEPEDVLKIDKTIDGQLSSLNRKNIYWSADYDEFEDEMVDPLSVIIANANAPAFGQPRNPDSVLTAENTLREFRNSSWSPSDVIPSQYY